jgi:hypothetical protein
MTPPRFRAQRDCRQTAWLAGVSWPVRAGSVAYVTYPRKWLIRGERLVDDTLTSA